MPEEALCSGMDGRTERALPRVPSVIYLRRRDDWEYAQEEYADEAEDE